MNGVVNVITKSASETQGMLISAAGGTFDRALATGRFGAALGDRFFVRTTARYRNTAASQGGDAHDAWEIIEGEKPRSYNYFLED